jgi:hypothetical protein
MNNQQHPINKTPPPTQPVIERSEATHSVIARSEATRQSPQPNAKRLRHHYVVRNDATTTYLNDNTHEQ